MSPHQTPSPARSTPASSLIRELPIDERPRERLLAGGAANLSDAEMIGILLRTGTAGRSAIDVAREVLLQAGGLRGLAEATAGALRLPFECNSLKTAAVGEVARRQGRSGGQPHAARLLRCDRGLDAGSHFPLGVWELL